MRQLFSSLLLVLVYLLSLPGHAVVVAEKDAIAAVLDDFHLAASEADGHRYFSHFAEDSVFLGTDATERWTLTTFKEFALPYFNQGRGWTYLPTRRHITVHEDGQVAWFDELLDSLKYGQVRGSGVMVKTVRGWKVSLYDLHFPIPNELAEDVTTQIKEFQLQSKQPPKQDKKPEIQLK